ncbi:MAG: hypothetical protein ABH863_03995 [Candidatus Micrarchaeota archaeon]
MKAAVGRNLDGLVSEFITARAYSAELENAREPHKIALQKALEARNPKKAIGALNRLIRTYSVEGSEYTNLVNLLEAQKIERRAQFRTGVKRVLSLGLWKTKK